MTTQKQRLYVGTYTNGPTHSDGIYLCEFDPATARMQILGATPTLNPSYVILSANRHFLYATNEVGNFQGTQGGGVSAFAVDPASGALTFLNAQPTLGADPCHLLIDASGKWLFVSNYSGGSLSVLPVHPDGTLGAPSVIRHHGSGPHKNQDAAHVHSTIFDPIGRLLVSDLGIDQIVIYQFDAATGKLSPDGSITTAPGAGPRHMALHPGGQFFYQINELNATIGAYKFHPQTGRFAPIQVVPTLAPGEVPTDAADLHVSPSGKFVYGSNRADYNSIVGYAIDQATGQLALVGLFPTGGITPRNFSFDLTGQYVLAANQRSDSIVIFHADADSGRLTPTGQSLAIPVPVCVQAFV